MRITLLALFQTAGQKSRGGDNIFILSLFSKGGI
jgi:hypothetical protein